MKRSLLLLLAVALLPLLWFGGRRYLAGLDHRTESEKHNAAVRTVRAEKRSFTEILAITGKVKPSLLTLIRAETSGRVLRIHVQEGDEVKRDDPLIDIDPAAPEAELRQAKASLESNRARLDNARANLERQERLAEKQFASASELEARRLEVQQQQTNLLQNEEAVKVKEENLRKCRILAPHDGRALAFDVTDGKIIQGVAGNGKGDTLMVIADTRNLQIEGYLSEMDVGRVTKEMSVSVVFPSIPELSVPGKITFISPSAGDLAAENQGGGRGNGDGSDGFRTIVVFTAEDPRVKPGIAASAEVIVAQVSDVVSVPLTAPFSEMNPALKRNEDFVYLKKDGKFTQQKIILGATDTQENKYIEVKSGLQAGDEIATEPVILEDEK